MDIKSKQLYVTYLDKEGPYIKVWGQTDRAMPLFIEKSLKEVTPEFEQGLYLPPPEVFQTGLLCCAKFKDGCFYRARITSITYLPQGMVEVVFVDYGNMDIIPCSSIRTMSNVSVHLISIPPQAKCFILAGISLPIFDLNTFEAIASELRYLEFEIVPVLEVKPYLIIRLLSGKQDVSVNLINQRLVISVPLQTQQLTLQQMFSQPVGPKVMPQLMFQRGPPGPPEEPTLLAFKVMPLQDGTEHEVYVSYVSDGPCLFSVQLQKLEMVLKRLMTEINSIELVPLDEYPLPGTVCLAQSTEDGYICRAVITSMVDGQYKVFYVDFGNTELLEIDKLFQIPFKYVIPKVMATRFALCGLESATVSIEMKCAFKDFVNNKLLHMRIRSTAKSGLPLCDLWDSSGVQALDVIRSSALLAYPEPLTLTRGFTQEVKVCYADSCNKFFVQLKSKETELERLMNEMQEVCPKRPLLTLEQIKPGTPCCAQFVTDKLWYRAIIINSHKLQYVDYGNDDDINLNSICEPISEHIFALRPQAIECCLNGYQNLEPDEQRDKLLEDLILEREFMMKVVETQGNRTLVELFDEAHYNVASLLLDRIATANAQASPLLIQDDSRIEHRRRSSPQGYRDKRPLREANERNNDNWRRGNSPRKNECKPNVILDKRLTGAKRSITRVNQQWEKQDSPEKTDFRQKPTNTGYNSSDSQGSGIVPPEKNLYHRGPKRLDGSRDRNFDSGSGDWNKPDGGENRGGFFKGGGGQRNENQRGGRGMYEKRDNVRRQPRGPDGGRNNENYQRKTWYDDNNKTNDDNKGFDSSYRQKRTEHKRDGNLSDGSDKSGRRGGGGRNFNRQHNNDERGRGFQKFTLPKVSTSNGFNNDENWEETPAAVDTTTPRDIIPPEECVFALKTDRFKLRTDVIGQTELVSISWFYNPTHFFVQLQSSKNLFMDMMREIQMRYKERQRITPEIGAPVIVQFPEDRVLYRAEVLSCDGNRYKVRYVDYGNTGLVDLAYPIESKYMELPEQAIPCGLRGILPLSETWGTPDTYSMYFNKEEYSCTFLFALEDRCCVEMLHDGKDLSLMLIEGKLAAPESIPTVDTNLQDLDINLLVGQQLMAFLKEVVSMSDIKVEIEPNLVVNAVMHNLAQATETYEDHLKKWTGQFVIIYVDQVIDDKLEITIYDLNGQKLAFLVPDEGAYDAVDVLCALPVYTRSIHGFVCYATSTAVYLQPSKYEQNVNQLLDAMHNAYNEKILEATIIPIEGEIYAVLSADGNWYRGRVSDVQEDRVTVTYVDYGNSENMPNTSLRNLDPEFYQPHMLAVEINLAENAEKYLDAEIGISDIVGTDSGWTGGIIGSEVPKEVDQLASETNVDNGNVGIANVMEEHKMQEANSIEANNIEADNMETNTIVNPDAYPKVEVTLSHIDSPSEFYLQLTYDLDLINSLQAELQNRIPELPNLQNPTPGILCAAPYSVQGEWYRAQVLDADDDITTVRFVDYGNTDVIDNKTTSIKTLPADMLSLEFHARLCSLNIDSLTPEWSTAATEKFESLVTDKALQAEIIHQEDKKTYVELYADGLSVSETLKNEGLAGTSQLQTENNSTGFISHLNSLSEFWVQMESSVPDLEWVADQLANAESFPVLEDLTPGSLCAAVFPADESWYRARILSNTVAGIEVIFIDYGNSCSCTSLRELPEDLVMSSPLAMKCSLTKPNGLLQWSPSATEKFRELSADGATVFTINVLTPGETSIVQMTLDGRDISGDFLPETRDCYVAFIVDLDNFWVHFADQIEKIDKMSGVMVNAETWPEVDDPKEGDLVAALFTDDGVWYRARILGRENEAFRVLFVDYGNEAVTSSIRNLGEDAAKEEPLCHNFRLDVLPRTRWSEGANEKFVELHADGTTLFQLEVVSDNIARLYLNTEDIRTNLGTVKCSPTTSAASSPKKSYRSTEKDISHVTLEAENISEKITDDNTHKTEIPEVKSQEEPITQVQLEEHTRQAEVCQPKTEVCQPETEVCQPKTEVCQPKTEVCQPKTEVYQPETEVCQPDTEVCQPETEVLCQPKTKVCQPETEVYQPKTEVCQPPETRDCYIAYIVSVDNFWVQYADHMEKIDKMANIMLNAEAWEDVEKPEVGNLVAALFEDGVWYRAKILGRENDSFRVFFVDYGNEAITTAIKKLIHDADVEEPLCANFRLYISPMTKWAEDANDKLVSLDMNGTTMFQLEVVSDNISRLYLNGENISTTLGTVKADIPETESQNANLNIDPNNPEESKVIPEQLNNKNESPIYEANLVKETCDRILDRPMEYIELNEPEETKLEQSDDKYESPNYEANLVKEICDRALDGNHPTEEIASETNTNDSQQQTSVSSSSVDEQFKSVDTDNDSAIGNQEFASPRTMDESSEDVFSSPKYEANLINEICDRIVEGDVVKVESEEVADDALIHEAKAVIGDGVQENSNVHSEENNGV